MWHTAIFLSGSAVAGLFVKTTPTMQTASTAERWVRISYFLLVFFTFLLAMNVTVLASAAFLATKNTMTYDPMATSAFDLLQREFLYELAVTRWSFEVALLFFIASVLLRIMFEFELIGKTSTKKQKTFAGALLLFGSSLICHLVSYMNTRIYRWGNIWSLTIDVIKMIASTNNLSTHPLAAISLILGALGALFTGKAISMPQV
mmetsp:Transcript_11738/g.24077  ORF Transcript_11738/g.24077 Transcript_11738/m.24077 type:complete len:204 (+) Transcript_11738:172-783(+)